MRTAANWNRIMCDARAGFAIDGGEIDPCACGDPALSTAAG
jgi:hypothetical protein